MENSTQAEKGVSITASQPGMVEVPNGSPSIDGEYLVITLLVPCQYSMRAFIVRTSYFQSSN